MGDASPPFTVKVTDEQIADFCRAARYENLVYTNQPAARETGLPGIIAPPAMLFAYAPARLPALIAAQGCAAPIYPIYPTDTTATTHLAHGEPTRTVRGEPAPPVRGEPVEPPPTNIQICFQGTMVTPEDTITSQTRLADKYQQGAERFLTFRVTAQNQRGELVADYDVTYLWERVGEG